MKPRILLAALLTLSLAHAGWSTALAAAPSSAKTAKTSAAKPVVKKAVAKTAPVKKKAVATKATKKVAVKRAAPLVDESADLELDARGFPVLRSAAFYVANQQTGEVLLERNGAAVVPIASITKLMTAMVVLEAGQSLSEEITINNEDLDQLKGTGSRLVLGTRLSREALLQLALMSSENRAASALGRNYPGGIQGFVAAMNIKARLLGMSDTRFHDSSGLNPANVSSPRDLARLVTASASYPLIREFSTTHERHIEVAGRMLRFGNTNSLVKNPDWEISVSKTGYISEAGRCLVMQAWMHRQPVVIVLMDSVGRYTRTADAQRVRKWLDVQATERVAVASKARPG
ncbi:MAG: peptidase [Betaproteobacteria bacterium HGW-Betaproteobacteria-19]|nr:MAG: peptidase [Betaproteobacteria bacterium HGW-Betaproteobacteria-19]